METQHDILYVEYFLLRNMLTATVPGDGGVGEVSSDLEEEVNQSIQRTGGTAQVVFSPES